MSAANYLSHPDWAKSWPHTVIDGRKVRPAVIPADCVDELRPLYRALVVERRRVPGATLCDELGVGDGKLRVLIYELMWLARVPIVSLDGRWQLARSFPEAMRVAERERTRADRAQEPIDLLNRIADERPEPQVPDHRRLLVAHVVALLADRDAHTPMSTKELTRLLAIDGFRLSHYNRAGDPDKAISRDTVRGGLLRAMREYGIAVCTVHDGAWIPTAENMVADVALCVAANLQARPEGDRERARVIEDAARYAYPQSDEDRRGEGWERMIRRGHSDRWARDRFRGHVAAERHALMDLAELHVRDHAGDYWSFRAELGAGLTPTWTPAQRDAYHDTAAAKELITKGRISKKTAERLRPDSPFKPSTVTERAKRGETAKIGRSETVKFICPF